MPIAVKDLEGKVVFYIDGEVAKDANGKTVAEPHSLRDLKADEKLGVVGSLLMRDRLSTQEGRQVLMDLAPGDVATAKTVAEFGALADGCVADTISPVRLIDHDRGVWYVEDPSDVVKIESGYAHGDGSPPVVNPAFNATSFITNGYALAAKLPRRTTSNADFDLKARSLRFLVEALRIRREVRVAQALTAPTAWRVSNTRTVAAGVGNWNGGASADPLADLFAALGLSAMPATHLVMPENIAPFFFVPGASSRVRDYVQAGGELPKVLFARAPYKAAGVVTYAWAPYVAGTTSASLLLARVSPDPKMIQTASTFRWVGKSQDGVLSEGVLVRTFFDPRDECDWVVCAHNDYDALLTPTSVPQVGALILNAAQ